MILSLETTPGSLTVEESMVLHRIVLLPPNTAA